ncbi:MAG: FAD-binding oxidoreductase [Halieaceae bacterium]|jgi:glycine/D-amino acid oxidase-like deaminating enzyme|nr:FAD-binding oxidoreductase [Halieaceae bacterium]
MPDAHPDYLQVSGWNALLPPRTPNPPLDAHREVDLAVIGAGFTGLACARRWHELAPDDRIAIVDSSTVGEGNPGRNSGFLLDVALAEDADARNTERMARCNELTRGAMRGILADVTASPEPIDLVKTGTYRAAAGAAGLRSLRNYARFLDAAGLPYRDLDREAINRELGTQFYVAGIYSPDCYLGQPAAIIRAIAARLPDAVSLYENTPALRIERSAGAWQVQTPAGSLRCSSLVLANNAFAGKLGVAPSRLAAVYTYAGLTPVLSEEALATLGSNPNWGLLPTHRLGSTLRRTADGRLLVRSLHDYESEGEPSRIRRALMHRLRRRFPGLGEIGFEHAWGGAVGFTYNGAPLWGEREPGLYAACGCNGGGTVKGTLFGRLLAEQALGVAQHDVPGLFGRAAWMPPEPLRGLGFLLRSRLESWQGRLEL